MKKLIALLLISSHALAVAPGATYIQYSNGGVPTIVSSANGLPISGSITATNPSVSATGAAVPASGTFIAAKNGSGNLTGLLTGSQTSANSLGVVIASDQGPVPSSQSGAWTTGRTWSLLNTTDSVNSVQSGAWSLTNITGTITLPTGAATSALQTSGNSTLSTISSQLPTALDGSGFLKTHEQGTANVNVTNASLPNMANQTLLGQTINANAQTVVLSVNGMGTAGVQITGTWSGTIAFEGSIDGTNFVSLQTIPLGNAGTSTQTTANGLWFFSVGPLNSIRVRSTAWTSGTATVNISASQGAAAVQAVSFAAANMAVTANAAESGTWTVQPGNTANTTPWLTTARLNDGSGTSVTVGQKVAASSLPVTLASDQISPKTYVNATAAFSQTSVTTTASTISAPANAVRVLIQGDSTNTDCVRYRFDGTAATATVGVVAQPGQDSGQLDSGMSVSVAACSGTQKVNVQYLAQ